MAGAYEQRKGGIFFSGRWSGGGLPGRGRRGGQYESLWLSGLWSGAFLTLTIAQSSGAVSPESGGRTLTMGGRLPCGIGAKGPRWINPSPDQLVGLWTVGGLDSPVGGILDLDVSAILASSRIGLAS